MRKPEGKNPSGSACQKTFDTLRETAKKEFRSRNFHSASLRYRCAVARSPRVAISRRLYSAMPRLRNRLIFGIKSKKRTFFRPFLPADFCIQSPPKMVWAFIDGLTFVLRSGCHRRLFQLHIILLDPLIRIEMRRRTLDNPLHGIARNLHLLFRGKEA